MGSNSEESDKILFGVDSDDGEPCSKKMRSDPDTAKLQKIHTSSNNVIQDIPIHRKFVHKNNQNNGETKNKENLQMQKESNTVLKENDIKNFNGEEKISNSEIIEIIDDDENKEENSQNNDENDVLLMESKIENELIPTKEAITLPMCNSKDDENESGTINRPQNEESTKNIEEITQQSKQDLLDEITSGDIESSDILDVNNDEANKTTDSEKLEITSVKSLININQNETQEVDSSQKNCEKVSEEYNSARIDEENDTSDIMQFAEEWEELKNGENINTSADENLDYGNIEEQETEDLQFDGIKGFGKIQISFVSELTEEAFAILSSNNTKNINTLLDAGKNDICSDAVVENDIVENDIVDEQALEEVSSKNSEIQSAESQSNAISEIHADEVSEGNLKQASENCNNNNELSPTSVQTESVKDNNSDENISNENISDDKISVTANYNIDDDDDVIMIDDEQLLISETTEDQDKIDSKNSVNETAIDKTDDNNVNKNNFSEQKKDSEVSESKQEDITDNDENNLEPELTPMGEKRVDEDEQIDDIDEEISIIDLDEDDDIEMEEDEEEETVRGENAEKEDKKVLTKNNNVKSKLESEITDELKQSIFYNKDCLNSDCKSKSNIYFISPELVVNYYISPRDNETVDHKSKILYVCESCYYNACQWYQECCLALSNGQSLIDLELPKRHEVVEIIDSDEEDKEVGENDFENKFNEETTKMIYDNIDNIISSKTESSNISFQIESIMDSVDRDIDFITRMFDKTNAIAARTQSLSDELYRETYACQRINIRELPPLDLNNGRVYRMDADADEIPPLGELIKPPIQIQGKYYTFKNKLIDNWIACRVVEYARSADSVKFYRIVYEGAKRTPPRYVSMKQMAYYDPPTVRLSIGTRVIALFDVTMCSISTKGSSFRFYPGIIGETLLPYNNYRYLVFFDDGYAQYVSHKNVRVVCFSSDNVWEDAHPSAKEFFRCYLTQLQKNRPMVQAKKGQFINTESNGRWLTAKVVDIDASLVQMQFASKTVEWIYRGSTRLGPLYFERHIKKDGSQKSYSRLGRSGPFIRYMQDEDVSASDKPSHNVYNSSLRAKENLLPTSPPSSSSHLAIPTTPPRSRSPSINRIASSANTTITTASTNHNSNSNTASSSSSMHRAVAKKSVSKGNQIAVNSQQQQQRTSGQQQSVKLLNNETIYLDNDDPKGKIVFYTAKKNIAPRKFRKHTCSSLCKYHITYNLKSYNPLAKPLLSGWERIILKHKLKKWVLYRGPCGRMLRNMDELHTYLRAIDCELNVDNFDFDPIISCLAEYHISHSLKSIPDISYGAENMIIPLINYYDTTTPPYCEYSTCRIPTEGVKINLDKEFLAGCDCTDDCKDRSKCSCWQLTMQGAGYKNPNKNLEKVGYQHKRLLDHVPTGIYECNVNCKCRSSCLNRVVQQPFQLKLQVFKTSNRGWGLRCINDIPKGTFICTYAGHLLTEQMANEGGADHGDEYFAELDYIEVVERIKEGYESDVQEDIDSDDEEENDRSKNSDDKEFRTHTKISPVKNTSYVHTRLQSRREQQTSGDEDDEPMPDRRKVLNFDANTSMDNTEPTTTKYKSFRKYFGKNEMCYVMDAKRTGNIGRYFNHSCSPNLFVQNVFVDTHDLRFPWVAFFAAHTIKAGTELTWNYNYEVGVVAGKVLYCECGSANCRGRLL